MRRRKNLILGLIMVSLLAGLAGFIASCCDDCPTCPGPSKPYRGWLYATDDFHDWVYMIDIEADSIVDSVNYETERSYTPALLDVSSDGRYLAVGYFSVLLEDQFTRIYDAQTLDVIMDLSDYILPVFVSNENVLLGISQGVRIYSIPDFTLIHYDSSSLAAGVVDIDEQNNLAYILGTVNAANSESTYVAAYDYVQREIVDQWFVRDSRDSIVGISTFDIHPDGERLYCITGSWNDGLRVTCYNLSDRETIFSFNIYSTCGWLKLSPDGKEIYVTDPGCFEDISTPGTLFIFDADDGSYIEGISLYGYDPITSQPLYAMPIVFTPTGERAFIGSGRVLRRSGTISVIDTQTRDIIENIWPDLGHFILKMAVGPKL